MPIGYGLAGGRMGLGLAQGAGAAVLPWYRAGGIAAANCVAAYAAKGAASYAASKVNLANPGTYDLTDGAVAPSWSAANGWTFNALSAYLVSTITPATQGWSAFVQFTGAAAYYSSMLFGNDIVYISPDWSTSCLYYNGGILVVSGIQASGNLGFAGRTAYRNGVSDGTISVYAPSSTKGIYVGCWNTGSAGRFFEGQIRALALYNTTITGPQVTALVAAMAAL